MEAATGARELTGEKAQRIVDAMRASVGERGVAGSTFDQVARAAGVSRGLLHYYFGTKERLLVEVCRRDCDIRMQMLDQAFASAHTVGDLLDAMVRSLEDLVENDPGFMALIFELFASSRRNEDIAAGLAELTQKTRDHIAGLLAAKQDEGVIRLAAEPVAVAGVIFALADGLALRMLSEPEFDHRPTLDAALEAIRALIDPPAAV